MDKFDPIVEFYILEVQEKKMEVEDVDDVEKVEDAICSEENWIIITEIPFRSPSPIRKPPTVSWFRLWQLAKLLWFLYSWGLMDKRILRTLQVILWLLLKSLQKIT